MKRLAQFIFAVILAAQAFMPLPAMAVRPDEVLSDPKLEERARTLSLKLRCLVCQNQSIDDSDAPLARDLRLIVRERLRKGDSDAQVLDFLVARYGDFVLLTPPLKSSTLILWLAPFSILLLAGALIGLRARRKTSASARAAPLSADEVAKLSAILDKKSP